MSDPDIWSAVEYRRTVGEEPISGYVLMEPLGRGGFGEVWKCEAPGGLHKAIKFVAGAEAPSEDGHLLRQEYEAFQKIKSIRHPFLLTLERVELVGNELIMVMELADRQLADRFQECRKDGLSGIPREELLGYFEEAAEALDHISAQYGLQHLDVKPANLFVTAGHVKVGDYGLVTQLGGAAAGRSACGLTPKYVAPEVLRGEIHTRSDQYSLALVYQELLTGKFPYEARTSQQMMLAHVSSQPNVASLPSCDQSPVFTALQKRPEDRYASCQDFVLALLEAGWAATAEPSRRNSRGPFLLNAVAATPAPASRVDVTPAPFGDETGRHPRPNEPTRALPAGERGLITGDRTNSAALKTIPTYTPTKDPQAGPSSTGHPTPPPIEPRPAQERELPFAETEPSSQVRIRKIRSVIDQVHLLGEEAAAPRVSAGGFIAAVLEAAAAGGYVPQTPGEIGRDPHGTWICRFPTSVPLQVATLKLGMLCEHWNLSLDQPEPTRIILRKAAPARFWGKKGGFEVVVGLPRLGRTIGEVTVAGSVYGSPDRQFIQGAEDALPSILGDLRHELGSVAERRRSPRIVAAIPATVHPLHSDGRLDPPVSGRTRDVSAGGIGLETSEPVRSKYAYVAFPGVPAIKGLLILIRLKRSQAMQGDPAYFHGGQFRTDL